MTRGDGLILLGVICIVVGGIILISSNAKTSDAYIKEYKEECAGKGGVYYSPPHSKGWPKPLCLKADSIINME